MSCLEVKEFRKRNQLTQEDLAKIAGVSIRAVQSWEQGQRNITQSAVKLMNIFEEDRRLKPVDSDTGSSAYQSGVSINGTGVKPEKGTMQKMPDNSNAGIPLIPLNAMAGFLTGEIQVLEYECERYVVPLFRDAEFLIQVKGSSMIPKYNSGDLVACKKLSLNDLFFQWNKVYVIDTAQGALIKRIKKGPDDDHILVVSDNRQYDTFPLHKSKIYAVALVVGVIRLE
jgi:phage repressor protein C with HTH and peptisase S24 domain